MDAYFNVRQRRCFLVCVLLYFVVEKMPHRCAFGCKATDVVLHVFPNPEKFPDRFKVWVHLVGGRLESSSDFEYYKKKRICDIHFTNEHRNRFKRLNALAVPSLYLPNTSGTQQDNRTNQPEATVDIQPTASVPVTARLETSSTPQLPETQPAAFHPAAAFLDTSGAQQVDHTNLPEATATVEIQPTASVPVTALLETSSTPQLPETQPAAFHPAAAFSGGSNNTASVATACYMEHNYSVMSCSRRRSLVQDALSYNYSRMVKPLQKKIKYLRTEISRLRKCGKSYKARLANAQKISDDIAFQRVIQNVTKPAQLFIHMQRQTPKAPKGRRFTVEEKILALSLYKKSPKCYRLLCQYFSLPSSKAMKRLLSQIKLTPGLNKIIFKKIKTTMVEKDKADRLCSLSFDEMSITPQIMYTAHKDELEGFSTNPGAPFADHALVFMVKGLKNHWKQPVAYYFTSGLNKLELKKILKSVIEHCIESGIIILNTVCDQSPVNVGAITEMVDETKANYIRHGKEWRYEVIRIMGHNIVPLYDTPHLIKGLRNNLLTKDLVYEINNEVKTVKWDYYQMVYNADKSYGELRLLNKLTEEHISPDKINKMRVKSATQLFSHSVAVVTEHLTARGDLPTECRHLIDWTLLLDDLFDSLNVSSLTVPHGKKFKGPIKRNSPHHELWQKAKNVFKTVKYIKKLNVGDKIRLVETVVPSVKNMIKTIEGMETLWKVWSSRYGLDAMLTRNFNQDPLENFFGNIRSFGARNIAPNTVAFEGAFKALLLNNFSSPHSGRANCEKDSNECLQTLDFFLKEKIDTPDVSEETDVCFNNDICLDPPDQNDAGQGNYVCGWVVKKCLKTVKNCINCRSTLLDDNTTANKNNAYLQAKEYCNKKWLCYPSNEIESCFKEIQNMAVSFLKRNVPKTRLKQTIILFSDMLITYPFKCPIHKDDLKNIFLSVTLNVIIYSWCRSVNRILSGKLMYDGDDEVKIAAQNYYNKRKHYKNRK